MTSRPTPKSKVTWNVRRDLYEEARTAALKCAEAEGPTSLSALFEQALEEKLRKLRRRYNGGRRFQRRRTKLLAGRPPSGH